MANTALLEMHAREKLQQPDTWKAYLFECLGSHGSPAGATDVIKIEGAIAPLKTRGPQTGRPNWRKQEKGSMRTAYITPAEHVAWTVAWSQRTGTCSECLGARQVATGWSQALGARYVPCPQCANASTIVNEDKD